MTNKINGNLIDKCISIVRLKSIFMLLLLIIERSYGIQSLSNNDDCPIYCTCHIWYRLTWASCAGKQLVNVHTGVSEMVQALDLSNNSISKLSDYELSMIGMKKLKYLNLSDNAISEIDLFAFAQLNELNILDLSQNHFNYLHSDTFIDNNKLRIIKLGGNNFHNGVPHLSNPTITNISLNNCQISHLTSGIFNDLRQLKYLDLSNNIMIELDINILRALPSLRILKISRNPWLCNDATYSLMKYLNSKLISYNSSICKNNHDQQWHKPNAIVKYQKLILNNNNETLSYNIGDDKFILLPNNNNNNGNITWENSTVQLSSQLSNNNNNCSDNNKSSGVILITFPAQFFIAGLIIGCGIGMLSIYIWLSRQQYNLSSRQLPLLDNISMQSDETLPTYFEVMQHSNRYNHIQ